MGGVGGSHLLTLTRLGIGAFHIADFEKFELPNFNRQAGVTVSHLDIPKTKVLAEMAQDINPELQLKGFLMASQQTTCRNFLHSLGFGFLCRLWAYDEDVD